LKDRMSPAALFEKPWPDGQAARTTTEELHTGFSTRVDK